MFTQRPMPWLVSSLPLISSAGALADGGSTKLPGFTPAAVKEVERLLTALDRIESYSDSGELTERMGRDVHQAGRLESTVYQHPNQFKVENRGGLVVSDGKNLTVVRKSLRRYVTEPLRDSWRSQLESWDEFSWDETPSVAKLLFSTDRRSYIGRHLQGADVRGRDVVDGESCVVLEGVNAKHTMDDQSMTSRWYIREKDGLLRRVVNTLSFRPPPDAADGLSESLDALDTAEMEMTTTYDVKNIRVDVAFPAETFVFQPKNTWKRVSKFYDRRQPETGYASQTAMSGKPLPWFDLPLANGTSIHSDALNGMVGLLCFFSGYPHTLMDEDGDGFSEWITTLEGIAQGFPAEQVSVLYVLSDDASSAPVQKLAQHGIGARVVLDPDDTLREHFADDFWGSGFVLIGKDGAVQGLYQPSCENGPGDELKSDIDQLLKGESLPGGVPMTEEEIKEMRYQRRASSSDEGLNFEPLNEDHLVRAWSVRTRSDDFGGGGSEPGEDAIAEGLWVRSGRSLRRVNPQGQVIDKIRLPRSSPQSWFSGQMLIARTSKGRAVLAFSQNALAVENGNETSSYPGALMLVASNDQGHQIWELPLTGDGIGSAPANLTAADVNGQRGDEVVFVHAGGLWVVGELGTVLVRTQLEGYTNWVRAQDLDGDGKAEVYVRYSDSLDRFDYVHKP